MNPLFLPRDYKSKKPTNRHRSRIAEQEGRRERFQRHRDEFSRRSFQIQLFGLENTVSRWVEDRATLIRGYPLMIRSFRSKLLELPWDGSLIGKAYPRVSPMVRVGDKVLVEEEEEGDVTLENGEECCPGGSSRLIV